MDRNGTEALPDLLCSRVINPSFQGHTGTGGERVYQNAKAATTGESTGTGPGKKPKTAPKPTRKATPQAQTLEPASPTSPSSLASLASLPSDTSGDVYAKVQKLPKTQEMPHPSADVLEDLQGEHVYNNTDGHHEYFSNSSLLGDDKVSPSAPDASLLDDQVYYNTGP
ncbi:uncharacterized protein LOC101854395, partial [Aplysia californica]|uniref:Uncharacterized protein LOC101854395 n=1 Tax=Aplysia californica TaxID=6500 RepID=A0ABM0ZV10_APLCA